MLFTLLTLLAMLLGVVPLIWLPIVLVLELGMANIFLSGYRGKEISSKQLFEGFNKSFFRNAGGMGWRALWLLMWALIPIAGFFIAIVKYYSYRFVPYIMLENPEMSATEALKKSMDQTNGYKGKMFLADLIIAGAVTVLTVIFTLVMMIPIPIVRIVGTVLFVIYYLVLIALLPLIVGTLEAVYYDKVSTENPLK